MNVVDPSLHATTPGAGEAAPGATVAGTLHGIGLGPGDPELLTVKAVRLIQAAPVIAYFAKKGRRGNARAIVEPWLKPGVEELALEYPVTTEIHFAEDGYRDSLAGFYAEATERLAGVLASGRDVALVAEGDPLFYGSFMHLFVRLEGRFRISIVPGVTGMSGCWTAAKSPITWGDDVLTVLPGTLPEADLVARLRNTDAAVVMKLGTNFAKVRAALAAAGRAGEALYVERGTMAGEKVMRLADKADDAAPYFSILLVPGHGRRP